MFLILSLNYQACQNDFMSLEEFETTQDPKTRRYMQMRSILDLGMGLLYLGIGVVIFFSKEFHLYNDFTESTPAKIFAVLVVIYGAWRIYRGLKKDYFKNK